MRVSHLSVRTEGQAGDPVRVRVFEDGDGLHGEGVPNADERVLAHLSRGHQRPFRVQSQTKKHPDKITMRAALIQKQG